MMVVKKFVLKDVRCFEGAQAFNIRPLTFLVGENSTGKSTVLGCMQALGNFAEFNLNPKSDFQFDFNTDPYQMGAYDDIARKTGGRGGGIRKYFDLGFEMQMGEKETVHLLVTLIARKRGSEPTTQRLRIEFREVCVIFEITGRDKTAQNGLQFFGADGPNKSTTDNGKPMYTFQVNDEYGLFLALRYFMLSDHDKEKNKQHKELTKLLKKILSRVRDERLIDEYFRFDVLLPPYADIRFESFAPIRAKPMRTYDPVREFEDPEGSGMPMTLVNMFRTDKKGWDELQKKLVKFGKNSGLFTNIGIKKHGRSVNDPFQLQVKVKGPKTNIIDVGYGVSQILPILVRIINAKRKTLFLMQQPEVHLHPKGQSELVSFMIDITNDRENSFVIETHSDAMINRARIEILNKRLKPEDVSLIYLAPVGNKVTVHNISFDAEANMSNVPEGYRNFFLKEQDQLLGFGG